jgi:hypothetical protein
MDWQVEWWMGEWENERARDDHRLLSTTRVIAATLREVKRHFSASSANIGELGPKETIYDTVPAVGDDHNTSNIRLFCLQRCGHYRLSSIFYLFSAARNLHLRCIQGRQSSL